MRRWHPREISVSLVLLTCLASGKEDGGGESGGGKEEEVRGVFIEQSWREAKIKEDVDMWQDPGCACLDLMEILYAEQVALAYTCMHVTKNILLIGNPKRRRKLPKKCKTVYTFPAAGFA